MTLFTPLLAMLAPDVRDCSAGFYWALWRIPAAFCRGSPLYAANCTPRPRLWHSPFPPGRRETRRAGLAHGAESAAERRQASRPTTRPIDQYAAIAPIA